VRGALEQLPIGSTLTLGILALLMLGVGASLLGRARPRLDFALAVAASVALSTYLNVHDLVLLLAPMILLAADLLDGQALRPRLGWAALGFCYVGIELYLLLGAVPAAAGVIVLAAYLVSERLTRVAPRLADREPMLAARRPGFAGPDESRTAPAIAAPSSREGPRGEP
jgi:hypothetical protein